MSKKGTLHKTERPIERMDEHTRIACGQTTNSLKGWCSGKALEGWPVRLSVGLPAPLTFVHFRQISGSHLETGNDQRL
jgi:hypothetical protein